jgi:hypothetical protein
MGLELAWHGIINVLSIASIIMSIRSIRSCQRQINQRLAEDEIRMKELREKYPGNWVDLGY